MFYKCNGQSVIISKEGLILTLSILPCPQGRIFWSTPCRKIDAERLSVLHQNSGGIGKSIPSALQISLNPRDFSRASPSGNLSGVGDGFPNTSLALVGHGYNIGWIRWDFLSQSRRGKVLESKCHLCDLVKQNLNERVSLFKTTKIVNFMPHNLRRSIFTGRLIVNSRILLELFLTCLRDT